MNISLIVAMGNYGYIGKGDSLPWKSFPEDMAWFKGHTEGKTLVMGHNTWKSIGCKPLRELTCIVVARTKPNGDCTHAHNFTEAMGKAVMCDNDIVIIGGSTIYAEAIKIVDEAYITIVDIDPSQEERVTCLPHSFTTTLHKRLRRVEKHSICASVDDKQQNAIFTVYAKKVEAQE